MWRPGAWPPGKTHLRANWLEKSNYGSRNLRAVIYRNTICSPPFGLFSTENESLITQATKAAVASFARRIILLREISLFQLFTLRVSPALRLLGP